MPETDTHREDIFLRKLMNKANIGWWEADVKTECYKCSGFIAQLLGLDEDGIISFNDFNKRILREDQQHTTSHSFDELQQTIEEVYLLDTPKEVYGYAARYVTRKQTRQETPRYMA